MKPFKARVFSGSSALAAVLAATAGGAVASSGASAHEVPLVETLGTNQGGVVLPTTEAPDVSSWSVQVPLLNLDQEFTLEHERRFLQLVGKEARGAIKDSERAELLRLEIRRRAEYDSHNAQELMEMRRQSRLTKQLLALLNDYFRTPEIQDQTRAAAFKKAKR